MYGGVMADVVTRNAGGIPSIMTIHGSDLLGEKLSDPIHRLSAHIGVLASRRAARRADGVITVSNELRDSLPGNVNRSKVRVIPCGIDLDLFKPEDSATCRKRLGWDPDTYHILFATNGNPVKRPEIAINAVKRLQKSGLKAEIHEMRGIPYGQVPSWINASHALILTSLHEGSPTIVKECLACNVPVVSVDVGDVRERTEGIDGCFIVPPNEADLASGLQAACSARDRVNSRDRIRDLSLTCIAERISQFYRDIISTRNGQRL
jgi:glycosyltransferase involved in cell wall biosynthesis